MSHQTSHKRITRIEEFVKLTCCMNFLCFISSNKNILSFFLTKVKSFYRMTSCHYVTPLSTDRCQYPLYYDILYELISLFFLRFLSFEVII